MHNFSLICWTKVHMQYTMLKNHLSDVWLQAYFARDALSKHIYSQVFNWIVTELNKSLYGRTDKVKFIGVLDIYG